MENARLILGMVISPLVRNPNGIYIYVYPYYRVNDNSLTQGNTWEFRRTFCTFICTSEMGTCNQRSFHPGCFILGNITTQLYGNFIWVFPKIGGKPPKWMVYNGKPYEQMDDLGVLGTPILGLTPIWKLAIPPFMKTFTISALTSEITAARSCP